RNLTDLNAKRGSLYRLVFRLSDAIINANNPNYFTMNTVAQKIPFFLIGEDQIPAACIKLDTDPSNKIVNTPGDWMLAGGAYVANFKDPDLLIQTISQRVDSLIASANSAASVQYRQRMVLDKQNLCAKGVTDEIVS